MSDVVAGTLDEEPARETAPALPVAAARHRISALEGAILVGILVVAALTRLPGLDAHGQWDADQGTDMLVLQGLVLHVLGAVILVPLVWAWIADLLARRGSADTKAIGDRPGTAAARGTLLGGLGAAAIILAGYLPLLASELGHGFAETRGMAAYLAG